MSFLADPLMMRETELAENISPNVDIDVPPPSNALAGADFKALPQEDIEDESTIFRVIRALHNPENRRVVWLTYFMLATFVFIIAFVFQVFAAWTSEGSPVNLKCSTADYSGDCGIDGLSCGPFRAKWKPYRCPDKCGYNQVSTKYRYADVVGSNPYKGTSPVCRAAIHAGVIPLSGGGCFKLREVGSQLSFQGSSKNGISTKYERMWFPLTYEVAPVASRYCSDITLPVLLPLLVIFFVVAALLKPPPEYLFFILIVLGYWYVALGAAPHYYGINGANNFLSSLGNDFIVVLAISFFLFKVAGQYAIPPPDNFKSTILAYVLPYLLLLHQSYFIYFMPDFELTTDSFKEQGASGLIAIIIVVVLFAFLVVYHAYVIYKTDNWKLILAVYLPIILLITIASSLASSTHEFHLHHSWLGVLAVPLTGFPTLPSAIGQSVLLGMFVNGVGNWGWETLWDAKPLPIPELPFSPGFNLTSFAKNDDSATGIVGRATTIVSWNPAVIDSLR
jgi:hypothetical protein